jgi:hypothetical protein
VPFDRLSTREQRSLGRLRNDPEWYGLLRPRRDSKLTIKSVSADTARLLSVLRRTAPFPQSVRDSLGNDCDSFVGKMVLDAILQIEVNGEMLCGPAATHFVAPMHEPIEPKARIAVISRLALEYGEALESSSVLDLSYALYSYNRKPASARWRRLLRDRSAVESYLGLKNDAVALRLNVDWSRVATPGDDWIVWQSKRLDANGASRAYKLYVSPSPTAVGVVLASIVEAASRFGSFRWKIGGNLYGLLRPDKLILYFKRFADLKRAGDYLVTNLSGCRSQGVPFTAELGALGLLSWGIDPQEDHNFVPWLERESWRARICNRLASALMVAKSFQGGDLSPSRFALQRLRLDGMDTDTWTPAQWT